MSLAQLVVDRYRLGHGSNAIYVERRSNRAGEDSWAVTNGAACLNTDGQWEYEPRPSNRGDDFLSRTRYSLNEALKRARDAYNRKED